MSLNKLWGAWSAPWRTGGDALLIAVLVVEASYPGTAAYVLRAEEPSQQLKEIG